MPLRCGVNNTANPLPTKRNFHEPHLHPSRRRRRHRRPARPERLWLGLQRRELVDRGPRRDRSRDRDDRSDDRDHRGDDRGHRSNGRSSAPSSTLQSPPASSARSLPPSAPPSSWTRCRPTVRSRSSHPPTMRLLPSRRASSTASCSRRTRRPLTAILTYHVIEGAVMSTDLADGPVPTLQGERCHG